jgi:WD40 repeat protein
MTNGNKIKGFAAQDKEVTDVRFNNDESLFATASRNMSVVIWDGVTQKPKKILKETAAILAIDFNPFNNNLVSVSAAGSIKLWDAAGGRALQENFLTIDDKDVLSASIAYSPDGRYIAVQANEKLYLFKADGKAATTLAAAKNKAGKKSFAFSPDGKLILYRNTSGQLVLAAVETGSATETLSGDFKNEVFLGFAQNAQTIIIGTEAGKVQVYDVAAKHIKKEFTACDGACVAGLLSLDGRTLITAGADLAVKRWDVSDLGLGFLQQPAASSHTAQINTLVLNDENQNGLLDGGEKASINITVKNTDPNPLYKAVIALSASEKLEGIDIPAQVIAGNIAGGAIKNIAVPLNVPAQLASGSTAVTADLLGAGNKLNSKDLTLQTGSSVNAGVMIRSYKFYSPTGLSTKGEPITMVLNIENVTRIVAENIEVFYKFPAGVSAIDKSKESIARIAPGGSASISVQFIVDKNATAKEVTLASDISGVAYSNAADLKMVLPLEQPIGTQQEMLAMLENKPAEGSGMRGSMTITKADAQGASIESARYVALVIGIDNYTGVWNKLDNATHDAKAVEDILKKNYNFSIVRTLYDKAATRQAIIAEFEWLVANLKPQDNLLIFYSGHGDFKQSLNRGFWVPADAATSSTSDFISNPDLQTFLSSIKAKHTLLISDACFSGDIFRGGAETEKSEINEKYYNRVNDLGSRQAMTSGGIEPVMDGGKDGHSVFTYYFLKALKENNQKYIDAEQVFDVLKIPVVNNSSQAPKFSHIKNTGDEGGEFIFLKK